MEQSPDRIRPTDPAQPPDTPPDNIPPDNIPPDKISPDNIPPDLDEAQPNLAEEDADPANKSGVHDTAGDRAEERPS